MGRTTKCVKEMNRSLNQSISQSANPRSMSSDARMFFPFVLGLFVFFIVYTRSKLIVDKTDFTYYRNHKLIEILICLVLHTSLLWGCQMTLKQYHRSLLRVLMSKKLVFGLMKWKTSSRRGSLLMRP